MFKKSLVLVLPLFLAACNLPTGVDTTEEAASSDSTQSANVEASVKIEDSPETVDASVSIVESEENDLQAYYQCENVKGVDFTVDETLGGYGEFEITGTVIAENAPRAFEPEIEETYIRLNVSEGNSEAIEYFTANAEAGNAINTLDESGNLNFNIGIMSEEALDSTAEISSEAEAAIMNSLENDEEITLSIALPIYDGMGAPANFSFACEIN